jgi:hypothetical protein
LNPLYWKKEHLIIWAALILAGAVAGVIFGWLVSPFSRGQGANMGAMLVAYLHYPASYWPWSAAGAALAGGAYYSADLLTGAR